MVMETGERGLCASPCHLGQEGDQHFRRTLHLDVRALAKLRFVMGIFHFVKPQKY